MRALACEHRCVGLALTAYPVGVERGSATRTEAAERKVSTLRHLNHGNYDEVIDLETARDVLNSYPTDAGIQGW